MSVQAISWALDTKAGSPEAKCILLCLANYADQCGVCWPSQEIIAEQSEQSIDTVQRKLAKLVELGLISRRRRQNRLSRGRASDVYQLNMTQLSTQPVFKPQPAAKDVKLFKPQTEVFKPHSCGLHIDEPSLRTTSVIDINSDSSFFLSSEDSLSLEEDSEEKSSLPDAFKLGEPAMPTEKQITSAATVAIKYGCDKAHALAMAKYMLIEAEKYGPLQLMRPRPELEFELEVQDESDWPQDYVGQFWAAFPRKVGKAAAVRKLEMVKKSGVKFTEIMAGVMRYHRSVASTEMQFITHPATWLHQGRWTDEEKSLDRSSSNGKVSNPFALMARQGV